MGSGIEGLLYGKWTRSSIAPPLNARLSRRGGLRKAARIPRSKMGMKISQKALRRWLLFFFI